MDRRGGEIQREKWVTQVSRERRRRRKRNDTGLMTHIQLLWLPVVKSGLSQAALPQGGELLAVNVRALPLLAWVGMDGKSI